MRRAGWIPQPIFLNPWLSRASRSHQTLSIAKLLNVNGPRSSGELTVNGFVRSVRSLKSHSFVAIGDGSCVAPLQAVVPADLTGGLSIGSAVRLTGSWQPSPGKGQSHELQVRDITVLGPSDAKTYPMQKKYQTAEFLRTMPHLRSRTPLNSALLRLRSAAMHSVSEFFASQGYVQTHPPIITSSDCEGAGEVFTVTQGDETAGSTSAAEPSKTLFFREPKYLTVSSQLHLEALAQSVGNVWALSPTFRAERSDTSRHLSEFYMLEAEMSFVDDIGAVMDLTEGLLRHLAVSLHDTAAVREILSEPAHNSADLLPRPEVRQRWTNLMSGPWPRLTYSEAINLLSARSDSFQHRPRWGDDLQSEHEKYLATYIGGGQPVFVTQYPRDIKAFYMLPSQGSHGSPSSAGQSATHDQTTVECFDLLVPEFCEIAGGSMREHRLEPLVEAMQAHGLSSARPDLLSSTAPTDSPEIKSGERGGSLDWYLDLRRWGCPPHGGFGLGFDRLLAYLAGVQSIRDMVTFPRWYGRCDC